MSIQAIFEIGIKIDKINNIDINLFQQAKLTIKMYQNLPESNEINYAIPVGVLDGQGKNKKTYDIWIIDHENFEIKSSQFLLNPSLSEIHLNQIYQFKFYLDVDVNQQFNQELNESPNFINDQQVFVQIQLENVNDCHLISNSSIHNSTFVKSKNISKKPNKMQCQEYQIVELNKGVYEYFPVEFTNNVYMAMDCYIWAVLMEFKYQKDKFYRITNGSKFNITKQTHKLHNSTKELQAYVDLYKKYYKSEQSSQMLQILIDKQHNHYLELKRVVFEKEKEKTEQEEEEEEERQLEKWKKIQRTGQEEDSESQLSIQERKQGDMNIKMMNKRTFPSEFYLRPQFQQFRLNTPNEKSKQLYTQIFNKQQKRLFCQQSNQSESLLNNSIIQNKLNKTQNSFNQSTGKKDKLNKSVQFSKSSNSFYKFNSNNKAIKESEIIYENENEYEHEQEYQQNLAEDQMNQQQQYEQFKYEYKKQQKNKGVNECLEFEYIMNMRLKLSYQLFRKLLEYVNNQSLKKYLSNLRSSYSLNQIKQYETLMSRTIISSSEPSLLPSDHPSISIRKKQAQLFRKQQSYLIHQLQIRNLNHDQQLTPVIYQDIYLQPSLFNRHSSPTHRVNYHSLLSLNQINSQTHDHLVVLVHGYQGVSMDMQLFRNIMFKHLPSLSFLLATSNEMESNYSIEQQGKHLAQEVISHLDTSYSQTIRVSFVAFSLGGLVVRAAVPHLQNTDMIMWTFMTLSTPHLGITHTSSFFIKAGLSLLQLLTNSIPIKQLNLQDASQISNCFLFKLSQNQAFSRFQNILLVGSQQDQYVPFDSVHVQYQNDKVYTERDGKQYKIMSENIFQNISEQLIIKIDVDFLLQQKSLENLLGRSGHIQFIQNEYYINQLVSCFASLLK